MYLHPNQQCWQAALRSGRIEQALRTKLTPTSREALEAYAATLPAVEELPGEPVDGDEQAAQPPVATDDKPGD
jgi:hypothetical protein